MMKNNLKVVLGISSGIAAYKILELVKRLKKESVDLKVILTESAKYMLDEDVLEKLCGKENVYFNLFPENFDMKKVLRIRKVDHIEAVRDADIFVIAPATANIIGKIASGIADDFLTTALMGSNCPILLCPSMNTNMWFNPILQANIRKLKKEGYEFLDPVSGSLACGDFGKGRLAEVNDIYLRVKEIIERKRNLKAKKIIITCGATLEPVDQVRHITNRGSGRMGIAIARQAVLRGAKVFLLRSRASVGPDFAVSEMIFERAGELEKLIRENIQGYDAIFHTASVSDYKVKDSFKGKLDSSKSLKVELIPQRKIIGQIKKWNRKILLAGFKAVWGVNAEEINKQVKAIFAESLADYVIVNDVSRQDIGFATRDNEVVIYAKDGGRKSLRKSSKDMIAGEILEYIF